MSIDGDDVDSAFASTTRGFTLLSGRHVEDVTQSEIDNAIIQILAECANHSCTIKSMTGRVLKHLGILTRGNPREAFDRRVKRCIGILEREGRIERYKAKNQRVKLLRATPQQDIYRIV